MTLANKSALRADLLLAPAEGLLALLPKGLASLDHEGLRPSGIHQISTINKGSPARPSQNLQDPPGHSSIGFCGSIYNFC